MLYPLSYEGGKFQVISGTLTPVFHVGFARVELCIYAEYSVL